MSESPPPSGRGEPHQMIDWDGRLARAHIPTTVDSEFKRKIFTIPGEAPDKRTGLPLETDDMRTAATSRLGEAIMQNEGFACLYTDSDNLKSANYISHDLGNSIIRSDAARICALLQKMNLPDGSTYVMRQAEAADETIVWVFGLTDDQLNELRDKIDAFSRQRIRFNVDGGEGDHDDEKSELILSTTAASVDSRHEHFRERIATTKQWMEEQSAAGNDVIPRNQYKEIMQYVDDQTKLLKIAKDIARVPVEKLGAAVGRQRVKELLSDTIAQTRVSRPLAWTILSIMEDRTIMDSLVHRDRREFLCNKLGIAIDDADHRGMSDVDLRVMYFDLLLYEIYESHGIDTSTH